MATTMASELIFKPVELTLKKDAYLGEILRQCEDQKPVFNQEISGWLQEIRQQAAYQVVESNFPTKKDEEWRFTDLSELLNYHFTLAKPAKVEPYQVGVFTLSEASASRIVFVNGNYIPELSDTSALPKGVYVGNLSNLPLPQSNKIVKYFNQQKNSENVFSALNTSGINDIAVIWADANVVVETPIHLLFLTLVEETPIFSQPRTLVVAEKSSNLTLIENYGAIVQGCSDTPQNHPYFTNEVIEIYLEDNAQVNHHRIQRESGDAFHIGNSLISQSRDSRYHITEINLGAKLSRHNLQITQIGEQTETILKGLTIIEGKQLSDTHSIVSLTKPNGTVNQLHKCIIDGQAHAVFNGKVFVPQAAQMTDAAQLNRNLLLSPKARIDTKPELQITADNVKCSHGATVSQLEEDEVFYLRSRGLNEYDARHLLIDAFAAEILENIPVDSLQQRLTQCVACRTTD
jgi:Fe-S cluster assembly protein SufD